jgi:hypothetical protein
MDVVWIAAIVALWALLACGAMALEKLPPLSHSSGGKS